MVQPIRRNHLRRVISTRHGACRIVGPRAQTATSATSSSLVAAPAEQQPLLRQTYGRNERVRWESHRVECFANAALLLTSRFSGWRHDQVAHHPGIFVFQYMAMEWKSTHDVRVRERHNERHLTRLAVFFIGHVDYIA